MLMRPEHDTMLRSVVGAPERPVRRRVVQIALELPGDHHRRVVEHGLRSDDAVLRLWCIRRVRACMPTREADALLEQLQRDRFMPVRREALLIQVEIRPHTAASVWRQAALDDHVSIRELGRGRLADLGPFDAAEFYRRALLEHDKSLAALEGLTETGGVTDLPLVRAYLKSPLPSRRRAAVRGLGLLGGEYVVGELVGYLRDDSPSVFKAVSQQLLDRLDAVPPEQLYDIVAHDHRPNVRDNTLRLIFEIGKWRSLPWLIKATAHEDESTSQCSQQLVERWFTPPLCNKVFTKPSTEERRAIDEAIATTASGLVKGFYSKLQGWLNGIP
jgi:HEAT repeat protein